MPRIVMTLLCLGVLMSGETGGRRAAERVEAPPERAYSAFSPDPARRFDFWVGRWNVNLRMQQDDLTFRDSIQADARVYAILDGKAVLELWDSAPIKGYSLRYYDPEKQRWILWLDWPGKNRSRVSSLEGNFRHGRGAFHSRYTGPDGQEVRQRYAFNDISPFSLRWDDLTSKDGGRTWSKNWIMEFSRVAVEPEWPIPRDPVPTYVDGSRCDAEAFRPYEAVVGAWDGTAEGAGKAAGARLETYRVLDGCAVLGFLQASGRQEFLFMTYLTGSERWETGVLDARPGTGLVRFQGASSWTDLVAEGHGALTWRVDGDRLEYRRGDETLAFERAR